jgi:hypothetical protein
LCCWSTTAASRWTPPRTTWNGTPLHELWLRDPTGYNMEMPADKRPTCLVPGTNS